MKYLKYFQTESEYTTFKESSDFVLPNVSYAVDSTNIFYNPHTEAVISYNMVDLGLPSGLKWADRNVGASSPEEAGLYFQWGDTVGYTAEQVEAGEKTFNWDSYFDTTDGGSTFTKYATDKLTTLESSDDAATVNMGGSWRMPTDTEISELINNTTPTYIDLNGNKYTQSGAVDGDIVEYNLKGVKLTGTNGNSIFIPAAGGCNETMLNYMSYYGRLWSSSLFASRSQYAKCLYFTYGGDLDVSNYNRYYGLSVRGVCV